MSIGIFSFVTHHILEGVFHDLVMHTVSEGLEIAAYVLIGVAMVQLCFFTKRMESP
jgi:hypothetical protein